MAKILVVEDEIDIAKIISMRLVSQGYDVVVANDGMQAVALAHSEKPDLIILDIMLPAGRGDSVLDNLKMAAITSIIPVIVLTALKDEEYKQRILEKGVEAYLEKPYQAEILTSTIDKVLKGA